MRNIDIGQAKVISRARNNSISCPLLAIHLLFDKTTNKFV